MKKTTQLEKLENPLFRPLTEDELAFVFGGFQSFTHVGLTSHDGTVSDDYVVDET